MKPRILAYKPGSASARALAESVGGMRVKHKGTFKHTADHLVVNWGSSNSDLVNSKVELTLPSLNCGSNQEGTLNTAIAGNKLEAFNVWKNTMPNDIPEFTTSREDAEGWVQKGVVVCRLLLRGSGGRGIVVVPKGGQLPPNCPLFVKYIKKQEEYRVHVFCGEIIDVQRKMRKTDVPDEEVNWQIRNHCNGFIFGREGVSLPDNALDIAKRAVAALHLDFGAVDLIYNAKADKYTLLEVNTAPGLEGTTLEKYQQAIGQFL